ncbi:MAG: hypothetical protein HYZ42_14300, partial [Bacteroidetes bacterium]|nr:hypothetical protein [Bacteroidota bacterium]
PPFPPFDWANPQNHYTINGFKKDEHELLATLANDLRKQSCFILISYPDIPFVRNLYSDWNVIKLDTVRSISGKKERKKVSEVLIKSY